MIESHLADCAECAGVLKQRKQERVATRERALDTLKARRLAQKKHLTIALVAFCLLALAAILGTLYYKVNVGDTAATAELDVICFRALDNTSAEFAVKSAYPGYEVSEVHWEYSPEGVLEFRAELAREKEPDAWQTTKRVVCPVTSNPFQSAVLKGKLEKDQVRLWGNDVAASAKNEQLAAVVAGEKPTMDSLAGVWVYDESDRAALTFYYFGADGSTLSGSWANGYASRYQGTYKINGNEVVSIYTDRSPMLESAPPPPIVNLLTIEPGGQAFVDVTYDTRRYHRVDLAQMDAPIKEWIEQGIAE